MHHTEKGEWEDSQTPLFLAEFQGKLEDGSIWVDSGDLTKDGRLDWHLWKINIL